MSRFYEHIAKNSKSEGDYFGKTWELGEKYPDLKENIDKMGDWLDDYINKDLYAKNIDRIVDEMIKAGLTRQKNQSWVTNNETYTMEIEEYFEPERMREELRKYHVYGYYNILFDTFHGDYSDFKHAIEKIETLNFGKGKGKNNTREIINKCFSYYRDIVSHRKWKELVFRKKREWRKMSKQTFAFKYEIKGTNFTSDWYDDRTGGGVVIITAKDEKHALSTLLGYNEDRNTYEGCIKDLANVHRLENVSIRQIPLSQQVAEEFRNSKTHYRYRPWHIFLKTS